MGILDGGWVNKISNSQFVVAVPKKFVVWVKPIRLRIVVSRLL